MVVGKFVSKLVQSLPSWEVTKYYGRVCWFQLQCLKYRIQTSETWFNFRSRFMADSLRNEAEHEDTLSKKKGVKGAMAAISKSTLLKQRFDKLRKIKKQKESNPSRDDKEQSGVEICVKSEKKSDSENDRSTSKK